jgi:hypothetical protein
MACWLVEKMWVDLFEFPQPRSSWVLFAQYVITLYVVVLGVVDHYWVVDSCLLKY